MKVTAIHQFLILANSRPTGTFAFSWARDADVWWQLALELLLEGMLAGTSSGPARLRSKGEDAMNLKRVLMLTLFTAGAALVVPGAAHAQVRVGVSFGGGY